MHKIDFDLFLLDMDGTIYLDNDLIDGAKEFIDTLVKEGKQYLFLTNNSSKSRNEYLKKLEKLNIKATLDNIYTSGMATAEYLNNHYLNKKVYLVGTKALHEEFESYKINLVESDPDIVVIGYDRELTYEKLIKACTFIDDGALFLGTNIDYVCPAANKRYLPDCGSMCKMITNATKVEPTFIGKPSPLMINNIINRLNINKNRVCMIGDRLYTDVLSAINANVYSILVLSGESTLETVKETEFSASLVVDSVKSLKITTAK